MTKAIIELDVTATMRDGVVLRADIYRPEGDGPWPIILQRTPYNKSVMIKLIDVTSAMRRGYAVILQDTRGRFASDGEYKPLTFEHEDGYDTVEWAASLPFSNGRIGMTGDSYMGHTQWAAAVEQPPHLGALVPRNTWADPENGIFFRGGALEHGLSIAWTLSQGLAQIPKVVSSAAEAAAKSAAIIEDLDQAVERTFWELPSGDAPSIARADMPDLGTQRALLDPSSMEPARVVGRHHNVRVPVLNVGGWFDVFQQGLIDNYIAMRECGATTRLIVGPWHHLSAGSLQPGWIDGTNFGLASLAPPSANGAMSNLEFDWFDHFLNDGPETDAHASGVDIFVMGINQWRHEKDWPLERAQETSFYLQERGALSEQFPASEGRSSTYLYDPEDPAPSIGGAQLLPPAYPFGPQDQHEVEARPDVLVFTTAPMTEDVEITGRVTAELFAATDCPSTDWVMRVCDVDENGNSFNFVDGIVRARTVPGIVERHRIDLWSTSIVIRVGHRIRVQVTSSNFPRWDRNLNTGEDVRTATVGRIATQTIHHDQDHPSRVILPIVPRQKASARS